MNKKIPISEIFCSIQGEGPRMGIPSIFIRFWGCNLSCEFCDSRFSWDKKKEKPQQMTLEEVLEDLKSYPTKNLIFTGGEPLLHQKSIQRICKVFSPDFVEVETNGTIPLTLENIHQINVSPKFDFSEKIQISPAKNVQWKFVIRDKNDLEKADVFIAERSIPKDQVCFQPEGVTTEEIQKKMEFLIPAVLERNIGISPRLHVLLWGDKRKK